MKTSTAPKLPKDLVGDRQKQLQDEYYAELKKADVEAQQQGFASATERGVKEKENKLAEIARIKAEKAAAKAAAAAAKEAEKVAPAKFEEQRKAATPLKPVYYQAGKGFAPGP